MKASFKPGTMVYPLPAVLVSCGDDPSNWNVLTVAWTGTVCSDPAMCYISVRKSRHSHALISRTGEFVINVTTERLARATDWCGVRSGRDYDKWREMNLTPVKGAFVDAPIVEESPINIECKVVQVLELGSHDMFIAKVVNVQVDESLIDPHTGKFDLEKASPIAYSHGAYYTLGRFIGGFGWSVKSPAKTAGRGPARQRKK